MNFLPWTSDGLDATLWTFFLDGDDDVGDDAQKMKGVLSCGQKKIEYFARSSTGFYHDKIFRNGTAHETCEIKDCPLNAVELRDSNNIESLKMLFYTTGAYERWT